MMLATPTELGRTSRQLWDVCVVGAGPAGAMAALMLSNAGRRVLLVEKARFPRPKACGGCLGGNAVDALQMAGLTLDSLGPESTELRRLSLICGRARASLRLPRRFVVDRAELDTALVQHAANAGTTILTDTNAGIGSALPQGRVVRLRRDGSETQCVAKLILMAAGLNSAKQLTAEEDAVSLQRKPASRIGCSATIPADSWQISAGELQMVCGLRGAGYVGIVRLPSDEIHIAAALSPPAAQADLARTSPGSRSVNRVLKILDDSRLKPPADLRQAQWVSAPHLTQQPSRLGSQRLLMLGDAAGYVEPFTGEGIGWALMQAARILPIADRAVTDWHPDLLAEWTSLHNEIVKKHHRRCRMVCRLLGGVSWTKSIVRTLQFAPWIAAPIIRRVDAA